MTAALVVFLLPPALFGAALLVEQHTHRWRAQHQAAHPDCPACNRAPS